MGWEFDGHEIYRLDGETDEDLQARAVGAAAEQELPSCERAFFLCQITE